MRSSKDVLGLVRSVCRRVRKASRKARRTNNHSRGLTYSFREPLQQLEPRTMLSVGLHWVDPLPPETVNSGNIVLSADVDPAGNLLTAGRFQDTTEFGAIGTTTELTAEAGGSPFIAKYDEDGNLLWINKLQGTNTQTSMRSIKALSDGSFYVMGEFQGTLDLDPTGGVTNVVSSGGNDIFMARYNADGELVWGQKIGSSQFDFAGKLAVDANQNLYISGTVSGNTDFDPSAGDATEVITNGVQTGFVAKYDSTGAFDDVWTFHASGRQVDSGGFPLTESGSVSVGDVAVDGDGNIIGVGHFQGILDVNPGEGEVLLENTSNAFNNNVFAFKLDSDGTFVWGVSTGSLLNDSWTNVEVDAAGNIYASGVYSGLFDMDPGVGVANTTGFFSSFFKPILVSLDADGEFRWGWGVGASEGEVRDMKLFEQAEGDAFVAVSGYFGGGSSSRFDPANPGTNLLNHKGGGDAFVWMMELDGTFGDVFNYGGTTYDDAFGVAIAPDGQSVYTVGRYGQNPDFDPAAPIASAPFSTSVNAISGYVAKFGDPIFAGISGRVYNDLNGNGEFEPGTDITNLEGWTVFADINGDGVLDDNEPFTLTSNVGLFDLGLVPAGNTQIQVLPPDGQGALWTPTNSDEGAKTLPFVAGEVISFGQDPLFGFQALPSTISGSVFFDLNGDGIVDGGENGIEDVTVFLDANGNRVLDAGELTAITNEFGVYTFNNVQPGDYAVLQVVPEGQVQVSPPLVGTPGLSIVSTSADGDLADNFSFAAAMSGNGRYVLFHSTAGNLVPDDDNGVNDVFLRDTVTNEIFLISKNSSGDIASGGTASAGLDVSNDGRYVVFYSDATNLHDNVDNATHNIYLHDRQTGETRLITKSTTGGTGNAFSGQATISDDGAFVVFTSTASNLVENDTNSLSDVFLYDVAADTITRLTAAGDAQFTGANGHSTSAMISADGNFVAFLSAATNVVTGITGTNVFVWDRINNTYELISRATGAAGAKASQTSNTPTISDDGRYVSFQTNSNNLGYANPFGRTNGYIRDRQLQTTTHVTNSPGLVAPLEETNGLTSLTMSGDGSAIFFMINLNGLVSNDFNNRYDILRKDLETGEFTLINTSTLGGTSNSNAYGPILVGTSPDIVAFASDATNHVPGLTDNNGQTDIFVHNLGGVLPAIIPVPDTHLDGFLFGNQLQQAPPPNAVLDIALSNANGDSVSFAMNNGDGTFGEEVIVDIFGATQQIPGRLVFGDFDGDGDLDVIAGHIGAASGTPNALFIFRNLGDGTFVNTQSILGGEAPIAPGGNIPRSLAVGDFDNDGIDDIVSANQGQNNVTIYRGSGLGVPNDSIDLFKQQSVAVGNAPFMPVVGDFDGDGFDDIAVANRDSNSVSILINDGAGAFAVDSTINVGSMPTDLAMGFLNGDSFIDLFVLNDGASSVGVLLGNGNGTFGGMSSFNVGGNVGRLAVGDFNGDGADDVVVTVTDQDDVAILQGNLNGTLGAPSFFLAGPRPGAVAVGDIDGDGIDDIVVGNRVTEAPNSDGVSILSGDGNGGFADPVFQQMGNDIEDIILFNVTEFSQRVPATLAGVVYNDLNANGARNDGEDGIGGVLIYFDRNGNNSLDPDTEESTTTNPDGTFTLTIPNSDGTGRLRAVAPEDFSPTNAPDGFNFPTIYPGYFLTLPGFGMNQPPVGSISGFKFNDVNGDGDWDELDGESGLAGWTIYIDENDNSQLDGGELSVVTGLDGSYTFDDLLVGKYIIREVAQPGWTQTSPDGDSHVIDVEVDTLNIANVNFGNQGQLAVTLTEDSILTNDSTPTLGGQIVDPTGELDVDTAAVTVTLFDMDTQQQVGDPMPADVAVNGVVTWSLQIGDALPEGSFRVQVGVELDSGVLGSTSGTLIVDLTGPTVTNGSVTEGETIAFPTTITFTLFDLNGLDADTVTDPGNYILTAAVDGQLGNGDDEVLNDWIDDILFNAQTGVVTINVSQPGNDVELADANGLYQLTLDGSNTIRDLAGNALDGDDNNEPGGDFVITFSIDSIAPSGDFDTLFTDDNSPTLTGTVDDPDATVGITIVNAVTGEEFDNNGNPFAGVNDNGNWSFDLSTLNVVLPDGSYTVNVVFTDAVGNTEDAEFESELFVHDEFDTNGTGTGDNSANDASDIATDGTPQTHSIHVADDADFATFEIVEEQTYSITAIAANGETLKVTLFGPDNDAIEIDTVTAAGLARISGNLTAGRYWVQVEGNGTDPVPAYTLTVASLPDLTVAITGDTLGNLPLFGGAGNVNVNVTNEVGREADATVTVQVFLSEDDTFDLGDTLIGSAQIELVNLLAGNSQAGVVPVTLPADGTSGQKFLFAVVDTGDDVEEQIEDNNTSDAAARNVGKALANLGGNTGSATFQDADGTVVTVTFGGNGQVIIVDNGMGGIDIITTGTDANTILNFTGQTGGDGVITINDITVGGNIGQIVGPNVDIAGDVNIDGTVGTMQFRDFLPGTDHEINIGGNAGNRSNLIFRNVSDTSINSDSTIGLLQANNWQQTGATDHGINGPAIDLLRVTNNFEGDMNLAGNLGGAFIGGTLDDADWNVGGNVNSLNVGQIGDLDLDVANRIGSLVTGSWGSGSLNADSMNTFVSRGALDIDLVLDGQNTAPGTNTLNTLQILGGLAGQWDVTGNIGSINVQGQTSGWTLDVHSEVALLNLGPTSDAVVTVDGRIHTIISRGWIGGSITAESIGTLVSIGSFTADLFLNQGNTNALPFTLTVAHIIGPVTGDWNINGNMHAIIVQGPAVDWNLDLNSNINVIDIGAVTDSTIDVDGRIGTLVSRGWNGGSITAESMNVLVNIGAFNAGVALNQGNTSTQPFTLNVAHITGALTGVWDINGNTNVIIGQGAVNTWNADLSGNVNVFDLGAVANTIIDVGGRIGTLVSRGWNGGSLDAESMNVLVNIGAFNPTVNLNQGNTSTQPFTLNVAHITNNLSGNWTINGDVNVIIAPATVSNWNLDINSRLNTLHTGSVSNSTVDVDGPIGSLFSHAWSGGNIIAQSINVLTNVSGFDANVTLAGAADPNQFTLNVANIITRVGAASDSSPAAVWTINGRTNVIIAGQSNNWQFTAPVGNGSINTLVVDGRMRNTNINPNGSIGTAIIGNMVNSQVFAGVQPGKNDLPDNQAQFTNKAAGINTLVVTGKGVAAGASSFVNSVIAAWQIGRAHLQTVGLDNGGLPHGVAGNTITDVFSRKNNQLVRFMNLTEANADIVDDDFEIRLIDA